MGARGLHRATQAVCAALAAAMVAVVLAAVVWRYALRAPISWSDEVATSLFVWVSFLGAALAMAERQHYGFEGLLERLPASARRLVEATTGAGVVIFLVVLTVLGLQVLPILAVQRTPSLQVSVVWVYASLPVGCALMLIQLLARLLPGATEAAIGTTGPDDHI